MRTNRAKWLVPALAVISLCAMATQVTQPAPPAEEAPAAVTVPFLVEDSHGNPVAGITTSDLSISDNGKRPKSVMLVSSAKELPLRLGVLIDSSNSLRGSDLYGPAVKAASNFLNEMLNHAEDRAFIATATVEATATAFMDRSELLRFKIDLTPHGGTALYDAILLACGGRMKADPVQSVRHVLVIVSDGEDNMSRVNLADTIASAQLSGTVIFTVDSEAGGSRLGRGGRALERLAEQTGGDAFSNLRPKDMSKVFGKIKAKIDGMYCLTYVPPEVGRRRHFRSVELKIISDKKKKAHAPSGYYVSTPTQ
jgi:VWFA-related protein